MENYGVWSELTKEHLNITYFNSICNVFKAIYINFYFENFEVRDYLADPSIDGSIVLKRSSSEKRF
jgi:hypothetical protein